jgi:hypothetical protein
MVIKSKHLLVLGMLTMLSMVGCAEPVDLSDSTYDLIEWTCD